MLLIWQSLFESWRAASQSLTDLERRALWQRVIQSVVSLGDHTKVVGVLPVTDILHHLHFDGPYNQPFSNSSFELIHPVYPRSRYRDLLIVKQEEDLARRNQVIQYLFQNEYTATQLERARQKTTLTRSPRAQPNKALHRSRASEFHRGPSVYGARPVNLVVRPCKARILIAE